MSSPHETTTPEQTEALGAELARSLAPGDVVLLYGEMGAGKTTFVRGAVRALGHPGPVTSPTYTIARHYEDGPVPVAHLDLHRLAGLDDEDPAFLEDHLDGGRIVFVEWPQIAAEAPELAARVVARVRLEHVAPDRRRVEVTR